MFSGASVYVDVFAHKFSMVKPCLGTEKSTFFTLQLFYSTVIKISPTKHEKSSRSSVNKQTGIEDLRNFTGRSISSRIRRLCRVLQRTLARLCPCALSTQGPLNTYRPGSVCGPVVSADFLRPGPDSRGVHRTRHSNGRNKNNCLFKRKES